MHHNKSLWAFTLGVAILVAPACNKDKDTVEVNIQTVTNKVLEDNWEVVSYIDGNEGDETFRFDSYVFDFDPDGTIKSYYNGTSEEGTWTVKAKDGNTELDINFHSDNNTLEEFDDEHWHVTEITAMHIRAQDLHGGDDKFLVLEKH